MSGVSENTVSSKSYFNSDLIAGLCREIDMPESVTCELSLLAAKAVCDDSVFNGLFSLETGLESVKSIEAEYKLGKDSFGALVIYMAAALRTRELYVQKGIPDVVYIDTIKVFSRFMREHMESCGFYGFDRDFWMYRCLSMSLFRLGALEFEMCLSENGIEGYTENGEPVLSVHIPSDVAMTRESLNASYEMAGRFFKQYFPSFDYKCMFCDTWMLSPVLSELLPPTSRILLFASDYEIITRNSEDKEYIKWVFKNEQDNIEELPEKTSLQRNIKALMLSGGSVGSALGVLNR